MFYIKHLLKIMSLLFFISCAHTNKQTLDKRKEAKDSQPKLTKPVARRIWIDPQVLENGSVYIDGHWKYVIQKESSWTK